MKQKIRLQKDLAIDKEAIVKLQESQLAGIRGGKLPPDQNSCYVQSCLGGGPGTTHSCVKTSCNVED